MQKTAGVRRVEYVPFVTTALPMCHHDVEMLTYLKLAELSQQKRQFFGRDRLLILAGAAACRAGLLDVADQCRTLVLANNPAHRIGNYDTFAEAMRSHEFPTLVHQLERRCPFERAEHMLQAASGDACFEALDQPQSAREIAVRVLAGLR